MSLFYDWDLFNSVNSLKTNLMKGVWVSWGKYWSKPCLDKTDSLRPHSIYYKVKPSDPSSVFTKHFQVTGNKPARCYVDHLCTVAWDKLKNFVVHITQTLWWISCQHFLVNHLGILLSTHYQHYKYKWLHNMNNICFVRSICCGSILSFHGLNFFLFNFGEW